MPFNHSEQAGAEVCGYARSRYPSRPLFWALTRKEAACLQAFNRTPGFCLTASRPPRPGQGLLLQLPGPATVLARVASVRRRPDGSWLVRCDWASSPHREEGARTVA
jgi:hypothetical protein